VAVSIGSSSSPPGGCGAAPRGAWVPVPSSRRQAPRHPGLPLAAQNTHFVIRRGAEGLLPAHWGFAERPGVDSLRPCRIRRWPPSLEAWPPTITWRAAGLAITRLAREPLALASSHPYPARRFSSRPYGRREPTERRRPLPSVLTHRGWAPSQARLRLKRSVRRALLHR
jgi:hypothetical protein